MEEVGRGAGGKDGGKMGATGQQFTTLPVTSDHWDSLYNSL